jgi:hypothetical protein
VIVTLGLIIAKDLNDQDVNYITETGQPSAGLLRSGSFIERLRTNGVAESLLVIAGGTPNDAGSSDYHPVADYYRKFAEREGLASVTIVEAGNTVAAGAWVLTCDADIRPWLQAAPWFAALRRDGQCLFGQVRGGSTITLTGMPHAGA